LEEKKLVHQHMLIKARVARPPMDVEHLKRWFLELVEAIGMKVCIPPQARYVDVKGNRGLTGLVGIETSHCAMHVWDERDPALIQMDVYSCAPFFPDTVIEKLSEFGIVRYQTMMIDRGTHEDDDDFEVNQISLK
jgi:S-adenosylmethionine/arginine decarboxylase-like enzyme